MWISYSSGLIARQVGEQDRELYTLSRKYTGKKHSEPRRVVWTVCMQFNFNMLNKVSQMPDTLCGRNRNLSANKKNKKDNDRIVFPTLRPSNFLICSCNCFPWGFRWHFDTVVAFRGLKSLETLSFYASKQIGRQLTMSCLSPFLYILLVVFKLSASSWHCCCRDAHNGCTDRRRSPWLYLPEESEGSRSAGGRCVVHFLISAALLPLGEKWTFCEGDVCIILRRSWE